MVKEMLKISKTKIDGICVENPPKLKETSTLKINLENENTS
jgi:hypothetical protein